MSETTRIHNEEACVPRTAYDIVTRLLTEAHDEIEGLRSELRAMAEFDGIRERDAAEVHVAELSDRVDELEQALGWANVNLDRIRRDAQA